jgi:hypothetical protein
MRLVETRLMIELDFYIYVFSMELRSFEKPYVALLNSSNWATGGPIIDVLERLYTFL